MVHDEVLDVLHAFGLRVPVLYLGASLVVEMDNSHAENSIVDLVVSLIVLINHFLQQQSFALEFFVVLRNERVFVAAGHFVLRGQGICFGCHVVFFKEIVRDVVVRIAFEIGFVGVVRLEI